MAKYVIVKEEPTELGKDEMVIRMPDFLQEVTCARHSMPARKELSGHYLRAITEEIGQKYDPGFDAYRHIVVNRYEGIPFSDTASLAKLIVGIFKEQYPKIFDSYIDYHIRNRPFGIKLIYFMGDHLDTTPFTRNGIDSILPREINAYMGRKDKKNNDKQ